MSVRSFYYCLLLQLNEINAQVSHFAQFPLVLVLYVLYVPVNIVSDVMSGHFPVFLG